MIKSSPQRGHGHIPFAPSAEFQPPRLHQRCWAPWELGHQGWPGKAPGAGKRPPTGQRWPFSPCPRSPGASECEAGPGHWDRHVSIPPWGGGEQVGAKWTGWNTWTKQHVRGFVTGISGMDWAWEESPFHGSLIKPNVNFNSDCIVCFTSTSLFLHRIQEGSPATICEYPKDFLRVF